MLTGVSLIGDTVCILLRERDGRFAPVTLPLAGEYDRGGVVDGVVENFNTDRIVGFFAENLQAGRFGARDETTINETVWPAASPEYQSVIDGLVGLVERNTTVWHAMQLGGDPWVSFDGDAIVLTLIARPVWDAIVEGATPLDGPLDALFDDVFARDPIAHGIYHQHLSDVAAQLRELAIVDAYLHSHDRKWAPPGDYGQHRREQIVTYLQRARQTHRDEPAILEGLNVYAAEMEQLFVERGG